MARAALAGRPYLATTASVRRLAQGRRMLKLMFSSMLASVTTAAKASARDERAPFAGPLSELTGSISVDC